MIQKIIPNTDLSANIEQYIKDCEDELIQYDISIAVMNARKSCIENTIHTLRELLRKSQYCKTELEDNKPVKTAKKKKPTESKAAVSSEPEAETDSKSVDSASDTARPIDGISMKEVAAILGTSTNTIANICNRLSFNEVMEKNGYLLTNEQVEAIREVFQATITNQT